MSEHPAPYRRRRRRRKKYRGYRQPQVHSKFGFSPESPWQPDEDWQTRHQRRLDAAIERRSTVEVWCEFRGIGIKYIPHPKFGPYYGWHFTLPDRFARWTPYPGYLVLKNRYQDKLLQVMKCHAIDQLFVALDAWRVAPPFTELNGLNNAQRV